MVDVLDGAGQCQVQGSVSQNRDPRDEACCFPLCCGEFLTADIRDGLVVKGLAGVDPVVGFVSLCFCEQRRCWMQWWETGTLGFVFPLV